jgi:methyl-accepting chemotaxis protein
VGEAGRGFTVVASEVRTLAERTASATADINQMLPQIKKEIAEAVQGVEQEESDALLQSGIRLAGLEAAKLEAWFMHIATTLHSLKHTLCGLMQAKEGLTRRAFDAVMTEYLTHSPGLLALSCCMEPDAFDGRDREFSNTPGTDATGRYIPYWHRGTGKIALEPLHGYNMPGENDYYELPRRAGHDVMIEPYDYPVSGHMVKITSLMSPLLLNGRFAGVVGADFLLGQLQTSLGRHKPFGVGALVLISHGGVYATHPEPHMIGRQADDLPPAALRAVTEGRHYHEVDANGVARIFHPLQIGEGRQPWALLLEFNTPAALRNGAR